MFVTERVMHKLTPWEVKGSVNYDRLVKEFGIRPIGDLSKDFKDMVLFRRNIIFAHRDFSRIKNCVDEGKSFGMITGLMPSGPFHLGHKMVADQIVFYQKLGAKIYLAVADVEAYNSRNQSLNELKKTAMNEYLTNYVALGLDLSKCNFYFQSNRSNNGKKAGAYYRLMAMLSRHVTMNEIKALYGDISVGKLTSALIQAADILHSQLVEFEGPMPVVVPVGVDQDVHIRLARDLSRRIKEFKFVQVSSTYHKLMPGLKGGKMSSSDQTSIIGLGDNIDEAAIKIRKYAFSGGRKTIEEHRDKGGNLDTDVSFQMLLYGMEPDDDKLKCLADDYSSGKLLSGELKEILIERVSKFLKLHRKNRISASKTVQRFMNINEL
jgi:tryptophanyl-tRNA synthetase